MVTLLVILFGLCLGSFLNMLAFRLLHNHSLFIARSFCPSCAMPLAWFDLIPILSFFLLRGACRTCKKPISWLYPALELITVLVVWAVYTALQPASLLTYISYGIYVSALLVATRTDLEAMLIPVVATMGMVPVGITCAIAGWLHIDVIASVSGVALGYGSLWLIAVVYKKLLGREGMGVGDMQLLAMIGAFTGPVGVWASVMVGSLSGLLATLLYLLVTGKGSETRVPFGPFLALGGILAVTHAYVFWRFLT